MFNPVRVVATVISELHAALSAPLDDGWESDGGQQLTEQEAEQEVSEPRRTLRAASAGSSGRSDISEAIERDFGPYCYRHFDDPAWPGDTNPVAAIDGLGALVALVEDIRNLISQFPPAAFTSTSSSAGDGHHNGSPSAEPRGGGPGETNLSPGPTLTRTDLMDAYYAVLTFIDCCADSITEAVAPEDDRDEPGHWNNLATKLLAAANAIK